VGCGGAQVIELVRTERVQRADELLGTSFHQVEILGRYLPGARSTNLRHKLYLGTQGFEDPPAFDGVAFRHHSDQPVPL
jgi:hypothetical protein